VYVRLPNNTTHGVPAWMFDEAICAGIRSAEKPTIACQALLKLVQLLDSLKLGERSAACCDVRGAVTSCAWATVAATAAPRGIIVLQGI
jgi:hypothetical protein